MPSAPAQQLAAELLGAPGPQPAPSRRPPSAAARALAAEALRPPSAPFEPPAPPFAARIGEAVSDVARPVAKAYQRWSPRGIHQEELEAQRRRFIEAGDEPGWREFLLNMGLSAGTFAQGLLEFPAHAVQMATEDPARELAAKVGRRVVPGVPGTGERPPDVLQRQAAAELAPRGPFQQLGAVAGTLTAAPFQHAAEATPEERFGDPFGVYGVPAMLALGGGAALGRGARAVARAPGEVAGSIAESAARGMEAGVVEIGDIGKAASAIDRSVFHAQEALVGRRVRAAGERTMERLDKDRPRLARAIRGVFFDQGNKEPWMIEALRARVSRMDLMSEVALVTARDIARTARGEVGQTALKRLSPEKARDAQRLLGEVFDVKAGETALPPDAAARRLMQANPEWFQAIDDLGRELSEVAPDLLPPEIYAAHKGAYLPYYYPEAGAAGVIEILRQLITGEQPAPTRTSGRMGRFADPETRVPVAEQRARALGRVRSRSKELTYEDRKALGLVRNPAYAVARGPLELTDLIETRRLQNTIAAHPGVITAKPQIARVRDLQGAIKEAAKKGEPTATMEAELAAAREELSQIRQRIAENPDLVKLPDGGYFEDAYGPLEGAGIPRALHADLKDIMQRPLDFEHSTLAWKAAVLSYEAVMETFRLAKVAMSPRTVFRNWLGNHFQADVYTIPLHRQPEYLARVIQDLRGSRVMLRKSLADGAASGNYFNPQTLLVADMLGDALVMAQTSGAVTGPAQALWTLARFTANLAASGIRKTAGTAKISYGMIDQIWKVASHHYSMEVLRLPPKEAAHRARLAHHDYGAAPGYIKTAGKHFPFIIFQWKNPRLMARAVLERPFTALKWTGFLHALDATGEALSNSEPLEFGAAGRTRRLQERAGMSWAKKLMAVRSPWRSTLGEPVDFMLDTTLSWVVSDEGSFDATMPVSPLTILAAGNPILTQLTEQRENMNLFTDRPIRPPGADRPDQIGSSLAHLLQPLTPGIILDAAKLRDAWRGGSFYGQPRGVAETARFRLGIERPVTKFAGRAGRTLSTREQLRDWRQEMGRAVRAAPAAEKEDVRRLWIERRARSLGRHREHVSP